MKAFHLILSALLVLSNSAISEPVDAPTTEAHWRALLSGVRIGMRRTAVEKALSRSDAILDFDPDPTAKPKSEKRGRTALYLFDAEWCAAITFDSTGFTARNNPYLLLHLPENRVVAAPRLLHRDATINKMIEQAK